jgi:hypothetical protein
MTRKLRFAAIASLVTATLVVVLVGGAYYAAQQVRPFYQEALKTEPAALEQGRQELESRATALYSDAKQAGHWQALFTADQINGWLATQLAHNSESSASALPKEIRDPRVAITRDALTLGFRTSSGGVETVISVDASVSLTETGAIAVRLIGVRAGALPLPVLQLADELAEACQRLKLPVRWTRQDGKPVALVEIQSSEPVYIDSIQLDDGQLYVAGHTEKVRRNAAIRPPSNDGDSYSGNGSISDYELRLTPSHEDSGLEIARRPKNRD